MGVGHRLTEGQVVRARERRAAGETATAIAADLGVSQSLISAVCVGRLWAHVGGPLSVRKASGPLAERIAARTDRSGGPNACWPWTGTLNQDGYGHLSWQGRELHAHKAALELRLGRPLAAGEVTRHGKDCPRSCVNASHLQPGTPADNNRDTVEHGRKPRGEQHAPAKLTQTQVDEVRAELALPGPHNYEEMGRRRGVTGKTISNIARGKRWKTETILDQQARKIVTRAIAAADREAEGRDPTPPRTPVVGSPAKRLAS